MGARSLMPLAAPSDICDLPDLQSVSAANLELVS